MIGKEYFLHAYSPIYALSADVVASLVALRNNRQVFFFSFLFYIASPVSWKWNVVPYHMMVFTFYLPAFECSAMRMLLLVHGCLQWMSIMRITVNFVNQNVLIHPLPCGIFPSVRVSISRGTLFKTELVVLHWY